MTLATEPMTLEAYLEYDDGTETAYELVNGRLVEMTDEHPLNKTIATILLIQFFQLGIPHYRLAIGHEVEVPSEKAPARNPDLTVHTEASAKAILEDGRILRQSQPVPLLVVEVASNSVKDQRSYRRDYVEKRREYASRGIPEYWIVDPEAAAVYAFELTKTGYKERRFAAEALIESAVLPDFRLTAAQVLSAGL